VIRFPTTVVVGLTQRETAGLETYAVPVFLIARTWLGIKTSFNQATAELSRCQLDLAAVLTPRQV